MQASGTETSAARSYCALVLDGWKVNWATNANPFVHLSEFSLFRVSSRSLMLVKYGHQISIIEIHTSFRHRKNATQNSKAIV
jgi:hypothetical protein